MVISYYGGLCVKVQAGETVLAFNPPSKNSKLKSPRFQANAVLVNFNDKDFNGWDNLSPKEEGKDLVVLNGPGEYEVGGVHINGVQEGTNTIFSLNFEDINICHLGNFQGKSVNPEILESIGEVDVVFVPINGEGGLSPTEAVKVVSQLEPKVIIPLYSFEDESSAGLKKFLKEIGRESIQPTEKFTFKKKELSDKQDEVVVLKPCLS